MADFFVQVPVTTSTAARARPRRVTAPALATLLALTAACGTPAPPTSVTAPDGTAPGTVAGPVLAAWCDDVPPLGPIRDSDTPSMTNVDMALLTVLTTYSSRHPDT